MRLLPSLHGTGEYYRYPTMCINDHNDFKTLGKDNSATKRASKSRWCPREAGPPKLPGRVKFGIFVRLAGCSWRSRINHFLTEARLDQFKLRALIFAFILVYSTVTRTASL
ncbi:hypothetical protein CENSYa_1006 [Cenarchaeum symbiosum A]|uniref:Uncharacterized protein n=1 Tax=Cenarchaeum symbiosum (strain A) TaxID=414004 RepID=A0RWC1_CENSY|nr:hypothetical protein CENSYa_1006 [Cenarchaeum symbiosum A]